MSRFLKELEKYDESMTLGELKQNLISNINSDIEKTKIYLESVKNEYKNVYLRRHTKGLFGDELVIIHIDEILNFEYSDCHDKIFNFSGRKISFGKNYINFTEIEGYETRHSLGEYVLNSIEKITKEDYDRYYNIYDKLQTTLDGLIR